jgi:hypothetical protein
MVTIKAKQTIRGEYGTLRKGQVAQVKNSTAKDLGDLVEIVDESDVEEPEESGKETSKEKKSSVNIREGESVKKVSKEMTKELEKAKGKKNKDDISLD